MKIGYLPKAIDALEEAPPAVRKAFFKQVKFLEQDLRHPSLQAKKYDESNDIWQARVKISRGADCPHRRQRSCFVMAEARQCAFPVNSALRGTKFASGRLATVFCWNHASLCR